MKLGRLNHVGVATPSIERSLELYRTMFNAEPHGPALLSYRAKKGRSRLKGAPSK